MSDQSSNQQKSNKLKPATQAKKLLELIQKIKEAESVFRKNKGTSDKLGKLLETCKTVSSSFDAERKKIEVISKEFNASKKKLSSSVTFISERKTEVAKILTEAKGSQKLIESAKATSKTQLKELEEYFRRFKSIQAKLDDFVTEASNELATIQKSKDEITKSHDSINHLHSVSKEIFITLERYETTSRKHHDEIVVHSKNATAKVQEITNRETEANHTLKKIGEIYEIATNTGAGGQFDERRKDLETQMKKWYAHLWPTTILLLLLVIGLFVLHLCLHNWNFEDSAFDSNFYARFLLTSPVIYYLIFVNRQHTLAKKLHDRYAFKTTIALQIQSHLEVLLRNDKFHGQESLEKILDFAINAFNNIYEPVYNVESKGVRIKHQKLESIIENGLKNLKEALEISQKK